VLRVVDLRCEQRVEPLGIDNIAPRFSWRLESSRDGVTQRSARIRVGPKLSTLDADAAAAGWDSGLVESGASVLVPYAGHPLASRRRYWWTVEVVDDRGERAAGEPSWFETAFIDDGWRAEWIEPPWDEPTDGPRAAPYLRREFTLAEPPTRARAYVTARGLYDLWCNGDRVGERGLRPRSTAFDQRIEYQTYDVTDMLRQGPNALGAVLGDGRYRGKVGGTRRRNVFGTRLGLLLELHLEGADRSQLVIASDEDWRASTGPITSADLKDGEHYDARRTMPGWDNVGFDDDGWAPVRVVPRDHTRLFARSAPPVEALARRSPVRTLVTPDGRTVVDLGQNLNGHVALDVRADAGTEIALEHTESLDASGNASLEHLQVPMPSADRLLQRDLYVCAGPDDRDEHFEPTFTVHGFRYVAVEGTPTPLTEGAITGVAVGTALDRTGTFECSDQRVNRFVESTWWSQLANSADVPTDCPTRERSGWLDVGVYAHLACLNASAAGRFYAHWLRDIALDQGPDGRVPNIVPAHRRHAGRLRRALPSVQGTAGFGDTAVTLPWTIYRTSGDERIVREQYESMRAWVEFVARRARRSRWRRAFRGRRERAHDALIWDRGFQWGEWLTPDLAQQQIPRHLARQALHGDPSFATAYFARSAGVLAQAAELLGEDDDHERYADLATDVRAAWVARFASDDGRLLPDRQFTYARALAFDLLPPERRDAAGARLVELVRDADNHPDTGLFASALLLPALTSIGATDVAYALLLQTTPPSWLAMVERGATTLWERWDGIGDDGAVRGSLNHLSHGSVCRWLYETVGGIRLGSRPGYQDAIIAPEPGGGITWARARVGSPYGPIESSWQLDGRRLTLDVTVPPNATADVVIPGALEAIRVGSGARTFTSRT
jgi:alpha-L-rhamnosidase